MRKNRTVFKVAARTDVGVVREHNEDNYVVCPDLSSLNWIVPNNEAQLDEKGCLLVIADGMGGLNSGEVASKIAIETVQNYFQNSIRTSDFNDGTIKRVLIEVISEAQMNMVKHAGNFPQTKGMGTTIVLALIKSNVLHTAWVGDSRCYVFRNGTDLYYATKDHSYVQKLIDDNQITPEQGFFHPDSNIITRSLGDETGKDPKPDFCSFPIEQGDRILLCSDGLNGMLQDKAIASILHNEREISSCSKKLIENANNCGGHDNITVILCDIISSSEYTIPEDVKLFKLQLAAKYEPIASTSNPFTTLKPSEASIEVRNNTIRKPIFFFISTIFILGLAGAIFWFWKKNATHSNSTAIEIAKDTATKQLQTNTKEIIVNSVKAISKAEDLKQGSLQILESSKGPDKYIGEGKKKSKPQANSLIQKSNRDSNIQVLNVTEIPPQP